MPASASPWLEGFIALLHSAQLGLLAVLDAAGLAQPLAGQPAWPLPWRVSAELLRVDQGLARQLAWVLTVLALSPLLLGLALVWRRARLPLLATAATLLALLPWSALPLLLTPATPTAFHRSPTGFAAGSILRGQALYASHCAACHGDDGRGEGPRAASLTRWPPDLTRGLLWQRADGDLFWRIHAGLDEQGRHRAPAGFGRAASPPPVPLPASAPAHQPALNDDDTWALIDYLHALAAGQSLRRAGTWAAPVPLPGFTARCGDGVLRHLGGLGPDGRPPAGPRLRLVLDGGTPPQPDPRLSTVRIPAPHLPTPASAQEGVDCVATDPAAWPALALLTGATPAATSPAGSQLLSDRHGWLRAVGRPPLAQWSDADLVCRSEGGGTPPMADGLGALIARMDATPVRALRGGYLH